MVAQWSPLPDFGLRLLLPLGFLLQIHTRIVHLLWFFVCIICNLQCIALCAMLHSMDHLKRAEFLLSWVSIDNESDTDLILPQNFVVCTRFFITMWFCPITSHNKSWELFLRCKEKRGPILWLLRKKYFKLILLQSVIPVIWFIKHSKLQEIFKTAIIFAYINLPAKVGSIKRWLSKLLLP